MKLKGDATVSPFLLLRISLSKKIGQCKTLTYQRSLVYLNFYRPTTAS